MLTVSPDGPRPVMFTTRMFCAVTPSFPFLSSISAKYAAQYRAVAPSAGCGNAYPRPEKCVFSAVIKRLCVVGRSVEVDTVTSIDVIVNVFCAAQVSAV